MAAGVTGATAVVVGAIGLLSTRLTARVSEQQIKTENEHEEKQRLAGRRTHREGIYHDLLNAERRCIPVIVDAAERTEKRVAAIVSLYEHINGAILFGTEEVARHALQLGSIVNKVRVLVEQAGEGGEEGDEFVDQWVKARRDLVNAMRHDVAPDSASIAAWPG